MWRNREVAVARLIVAVEVVAVAPAGKGQFRHDASPALGGRWAPPGGDFEAGATFGPPAAQHSPRGPFSTSSPGGKRRWSHTLSQSRVRAKGQ